MHHTHLYYITSLLKPRNSLNLSNYFLTSTAPVSGQPLNLQSMSQILRNTILKDFWTDLSDQFCDLCARSPVRKSLSIHLTIGYSWSIWAEPLMLLTVCPFHMIHWKDPTQMNVLFTNQTSAVYFMNPEES